MIKITEVEGFCDKLEDYFAIEIDRDGYLRDCVNYVGDLVYVFAQEMLESGNYGELGEDGILKVMGDLESMRSEDMVDCICDVDDTGAFLSGAKENENVYRHNMQLIMRQILWFEDYVC